MFADSGNGTGSTNSSRPQSQVIIGDPHVTPNNHDSPQLKLSSDKAGNKEVPEKHREVAPSVEVKKTEEISQPNSLITSDGAICKSNTTNNDNTSDTTKDIINLTPKDTTSDTTKDIASDIAKDTTSDTTKDIASDTAKGTTSDTAKDTTSDTAKDTTIDTTTKDNTTDDITKDITSETITSDTAKDTTSDTTKDTTNDTTKDTTNDAIKDTVIDNSSSNLESVLSKTVAKETNEVSISDIAEDTVADKAWQVNDKQEEKVSEKEPIDAKKNVDKLDLKNDFEEEDDVFETNLPTHFMRKSQFDPASPKSPNMSPRLSVGTSSPISMSPRPRRSSFVSSLCVTLCVCNPAINYTWLHMLYGRGCY